MNCFLIGVLHGVPDQWILPLIREVKTKEYGKKSNRVLFWVAFLYRFYRLAT